MEKITSFSKPSTMTNLAKLPRCESLARIEFTGLDSLTFGSIISKLGINRKILTLILMENENDSLARLAHAHGMTDLEIEEREAVLAEIASQQVIRRRMEEEEADRQALREFSENEDIDWGFHDHHDF